MRKIIFLFVFVSIISLGCDKSSKNKIIDDLDKKLSNMKSYEFNGVLSISNNEDTYNYDVSVAHRDKDDYRVSIINKPNGHEQIILKNNDDVYVVTY